MTIDDFLARLSKVTSSGDGWSARCPAHEDSQASLTVSQGDDGKILLHCHTGCSAASVVLSLGLDMRDIFPEDSDPPPRRRKKKPQGDGEIRTTEEIRSWPWTRAVYVYRDAQGAAAYCKVRMQPPDAEKTFSFYRAAGTDMWTKGLSASERLLYRLPEVLEAVRAGRVVWGCEGEKDADNLAALGLVATSNPEGAGKGKCKWRDEYSQALRGADVVLLEDNDEAGRLHVQGVATKLHGIARSIRVLSFPELEAKADVSDWLAQGGTREQLERMAKAAPLWTPPVGSDADRPHLTDWGNARRLVARHGQDLRFCHPWKSWLVWDEHHWQRDTTAEIERRAKDTVRAMFCEAAAGPNGIDKQLSEWAIKSEAHARIGSMIAMATSEPEVPILPDALDKDRWSLNVANGTLDLRTGILRPHRREDYHSKLAPVEYHPDAECPLWLSTLELVMEGRPQLVGYLQRLMGYMLTGDTSENCLVVAYGIGRNGKGTVFETFQALLGDYAKTAEFGTFVDKKQESVRNDLADLKGARMVLASEGKEGERLAEAFVKSATGGDTLKARFLYQEYFQFVPEFKLVLATNHKPAIRGTDEGIWSRIRLLPFENVIPKSQRDLKMKDKLRGELPGILAWAVRGCLEWQQNGLQEPPEVVGATEKYRGDQDRLRGFIEECCVLQSTAATPARELYAAYKEWAESSDIEPSTIAVFGKRLGERGLKWCRKFYEKRASTFWLGIRLRTDEDSHAGMWAAEDSMQNTSLHHAHETPFMHAALTHPHDLMSTHEEQPSRSRVVQEEFLI